MGIVAALHLRIPCFNPELRLLSLQSICACDPHVHMGFLEILFFLLPHLKKMLEGELAALYCTKV